ncbi:MAG: DUF4136 domain-containing protein [Cyclobacteriaceae bacterium]|jgi:hypothetical protein|nr:DUF4136 domain-containing protein [Cyclobacteriaceae bacterium]
MKTLLSTWALCVLALASLAQVHVDYDRNVNFKGYKTYRFEPGRIIRQLGLQDTVSSLINQHVEAALSTQLRQKGLSESGTNPDLIVTFIAGAREKREIHNYLTTPGFFYPYYRFYSLNTWWGPQWNNFWVDNYEEGTLIVDIIDSKTDHLIWRGYGVAPINRFNEEKFVERELGKLLKQFPPSTKS